MESSYKEQKANIPNVVNLICKELDMGTPGVAGISYDLSKAFDLVV